MKKPMLTKAEWKKDVASAQFELKEAKTNLKEVKKEIAGYHKEDAEQLQVAETNVTAAMKALAKAQAAKHTEK